MRGDNDARLHARRKESGARSADWRPAISDGRESRWKTADCADHADRGAAAAAIPIGRSCGIEDCGIHAATLMGGCGRDEYLPRGTQKYTDVYVSITLDADAISGTMENL
nr:hypothetical protein P413_13 [uncultured bacterium]